MASDILPFVSTINEQLQEAREKLRETEDNIKKVTGRDIIIDPTRVPRRNPGSNAPPPSQPSLRGSAVRTQSFIGENATFPRPPDDLPPVKRPRFHPIVAPENAVNVPPRRGGWDDDDEYRRRKVQSTVIVDSTPRKTREERITEAQSVVGDKDVARNRRIFGSLMGTLKKFQQEQHTRAVTDERQKEIRRKLEEKEAAEKEKIKREKKELFYERECSQTVVKFLETKMDIVKRFTAWEASQKPLTRFLKTEGESAVYYQPKTLNKLQEEKLEKTRKALEDEIQQRREKMEEQLRHMDKKIEGATYHNKRMDIPVEERMEETARMVNAVPMDEVEDIDFDVHNDVEGLELLAVDAQSLNDSTKVEGNVGADGGDGEADMDLEENGEVPEKGVERVSNDVKPEDDTGNEGSTS